MLDLVFGSLSFILGLLSLYHFWFQSLRSTKLGNQLPGKNPLPIVGNAFQFLNQSPTDVMKTAIKLFGEKGKIIRLWHGSRLSVVLADPRDVELVLGSSAHLEKSSEYRFFEPWLGDGLLISKGERWRSHRKMIAPTFHQSILKTFVPDFNRNANNLLELLRKEVVGRVCDIHDYMSSATVDVLLETVMGTKKTKEAKSSFHYAKAVMDLCNILHLRHYKFWLRYDFIFKFSELFKQQMTYIKTVHNLTEKVIKHKKIDYFNRRVNDDKSSYIATAKETEEESKINQNHNFGSGLRDDLDIIDDSVGEKKRLAFLDFMIEASDTKGSNITDKDIRDEVNTLMFEGHDTTAAASSFFICILGIYPKIQNKVYHELQSIFQGSDRSVTFQDTLEMKYLERVLLETIRMYPPVPAISRVIREDLKLVSKNLTIPKNATVVIPQFFIHRDSKYFDNPDTFNPDNFLPEKCAQRHFYSFVPFSAGPRSCVGRKYAMLKLKILLAQIVRNFKIKSVVKEDQFELQIDIILKRADGFRVILEKR